MLLGNETIIITEYHEAGIGFIRIEDGNHKYFGLIWAPSMSKEWEMLSELIQVGIDHSKYHSKIGWVDGKQEPIDYSI